MGINFRDSGIKDKYLKKYKEISKEKIILYLLFDLENPSSVRNCITSARENIRMVRTAVTLEVWNAINSSFHELDKNIEYTKNILKELPEIIEWVKKQVNLMRGTILNTQLINDGYDFLILRHILNGLILQQELLMLSILFYFQV